MDGPGYRVEIEQATVKGANKVLEKLDTLHPSGIFTLRLSVIHLRLFNLFFHFFNLLQGSSNALLFILPMNITIKFFLLFIYCVQN